MIKFALQLALCIALSVGGWFVVGTKIYLILAVLAAITAIGMMLMVPGRLERIDSEIEPFPWSDVGQTILVGCFLGSIWVALPIVVFLGNERRPKADERP